MTQWLSKCRQVDADSPADLGGVGEGREGWEGTRAGGAVAGPQVLSQRRGSQDWLSRPLGRLRSLTAVMSQGGMSAPRRPLDLPGYPLPRGGAETVPCTQLSGQQPGTEDT